VHTDICLQQQFFELVPQVVVDRARLLEDAGDAREDTFT